MNVKLKALVIDDSGVMRKMVMKSLTDANLGQFEFVEAEDGRDGLAKLAANEVHIGFVDWNMPNMTGIEFVREVRKLEKEKGQEGIPLVMVTSEKTIAKIEEALDQAGADTFITKPFTVAELSAKLKKAVSKAELVCLSRRRQQREEQQTAAQPAAQGGFFSKLFG